MENTIKTAIIILLISLHLSAIAQNPKAVYFDKQEIEIRDFSAMGLILDIGGGGEGVIGQLKGEQVISIDLFKEELVNAPSKNLKIVMDARDLKFIENSFNTAAIFYTMMYISANDHLKVMQEVNRVLKFGGKLKIWDVVLPVWPDTSKLYGVYRFKFILPGTEINTGYGVPFAKSTEQDLDYYIDLGKKVGLRYAGGKTTGNSLFVEFQKQKSIADTLSRLIDESGIGTAIIRYNELKKQNNGDFYFGSDVMLNLCLDLIASGKAVESFEVFKLVKSNLKLDEGKVNSYGYKLLNKKKYNEALVVFKTNMELFPGSSNVYDSYAEACMESGKFEEAVLNYKKSLELNPNNQNAIQKLDELKIRK